MKKVRVSLSPAVLNMSRSSVASSSPPAVQVHFFCQMKLLCRSIPPASWMVCAS